MLGGIPRGGAGRASTRWCASPARWAKTGSVPSLQPAGCASAASNARRATSKRRRQRCCPCPPFREEAMAKIRHIAITAEDPLVTAELFKNALGLEEISRGDSDMTDLGHG